MNTAQSFSEPLSKEPLWLLQGEVNGLRARLHGLYLVAFLLTCAVGFLFWQGQRLAGELAARPPIAVLDVTRHVMQASAEHPELRADTAVTAAFERATTLAGQGYLVINKDSIVAMPEGYEVP